KLQGVTYYWKAKDFPDKNFTDDKQIGLIAQELEKVYPELVVTDKEGYKSVDYSKLTPILVEAIKEQQKEIKELKTLIEGLIKK
ncbi:MAG: tail fiber domain-containing protein, partial [Bacteroidetes bacterium]|nr:tail fiber domain-containing protein [Bacteroidota bacterium]